MFRRSAAPRFPVSDAETRRRRLEPRMRNDPEHDAEDEDEECDEEESMAPAPRAPRQPRAAAKPARRSWGGYELPSLGLLAAPRASERTTLSADLIRENGAALEGVLAEFGVRGEIIDARPGPVVTLYELEPAPGVKSSRVISLADDIARSMSALSAASPWSPAATPSASNCPTRTARRSTCATCWPRATTTKARRGCRSASARPSAAKPSSSTWRACRIC